METFMSRFQERADRRSRSRSTASTTIPRSDRCSHRGKSPPRNEPRDRSGWKHLCHVFRNARTEGPGRDLPHRRQFQDRIGVPIAENLHPVTNPAIDQDGNIYVTFSGTRGQKVPVAIYRIDDNSKIGSVFPSRKISTP